MCGIGSHIAKPWVLAASFALLCAPPRAHGQQSPSTNANFYPLGIGDYWVYWDYAAGSFGVWDTITVRVFKDSTVAGQTYRMTEGHSWHYGNTWRSFCRADTIGDILSLNPVTGVESIKYRLSDTSHTWWDDQLRRFDSSAVLLLFGDWRRCLYVGNYNFSNGDTVLYSTELLVENLGFYVTIYYGIIDGGPTILAGGSIGGVPFGSVVDVRGNDPALPVGITLHPPYPNPFNPTATIQYSVSQRCYVCLEILDILGEQVALLHGGGQEPGIHYVVWDGSGRASGIYFCRLQAAGVTQTHRLLLLR